MDFKQTVLQSWQGRLERAREALAELENELACQQYELQITERVRAKAPSEAERDDWRIQVDVLSMIVGQTEGRIEEEQAEIALCTAMLAELNSDLATG